MKSVVIDPTGSAVAAVSGCTGGDWKAIYRPNLRKAAAMPYTIEAALGEDTLLLLAKVYLVDHVSGAGGVHPNAQMMAAGPALAGLVYDLLRYFESISPEDRAWAHAQDAAARSGSSGNLTHADVLWERAETLMVRLGLRR